MGDDSAPLWQHPLFVNFFAPRKYGPVAQLSIYIVFIINGRVFNNVYYILYIISFNQWENNKIRLGTHFNDNNNNKIISRSSIAVGYTIDIK